MTENNQFLDPPIAPQDRSDVPGRSDGDAPEMSEDPAIQNDFQDLKQNEGYKSLCRE
ncbi:hypothetical protein [Cohnella cholangitidis]|uniref:hypothetical protein n=1 Tax=Cohnella cholangitidis TaxID=2598458 RepID=UPI0015F83CAD|nr:hypothetical protein [Cohnella cholangitidis]